MGDPTLPSFTGSVGENPPPSSPTLFFEVKRQRWSMSGSRTLFAVLGRTVMGPQVCTPSRLLQMIFLNLETMHGRGMRRPREKSEAYTKIITNDFKVVITFNLSGPWFSHL